ncbi:MAG TPA: hypothetical protein VH331_06630 [Allosphingosinicella sp.]|jgi:hypothetical protein|nr:hypothetical protein [Allosphingosinicella sp.]
MQQQRSRLSLRLSGPEQDAGEARVGLIAGAIRNQLSLRARYNDQQVVIAPQILFTRHEAPHVEALVLERDGRKDAEPRLRTFNLAGLHELKTSGLLFEPHNAELDEEKYERDGVRILAVASTGLRETPPQAAIACSPKRPWGIHAKLDDGGACPRCGWAAKRA